MGRLLQMFMLLLLLPMFSAAQQLTFCLDHNKEGRPLAADTLFELDQFGQEIDFLLQNSVPFATSKLYFFIDKKVDGGFVEYDTKSLEPEEGRSWASLSYRFERSGKYRVVLLDAEKKELCRGSLKVNVLRDVGGPSYFQDAEVFFCHSVQDGEPDSKLKDLSLGLHKRRDIRILLKHYRPLRFQKLLVDVWRTVSEMDEFDNMVEQPPAYVETMEFEIEPHWMFTQFEYSFREPGAYSFRVYSEDEVWIATGHVKVAK